MSNPDIKLHKPEEFDKRFVEHTTNTDTYEEAYLLTENDFKTVFGQRKYSNYNSFRASRSQRLKRKKQDVFIDG